MFDIVIDFINTYIVSFVVHFLCAIIVLLLGFRLSKLLVKHILRMPFFRKVDSNMQTLIKNVLKIVFNTIIIVIAVEIIGVPGATILTVLGSCGLAIGLALQGGLSNLAGGVMIMFFKPFHTGDYITTTMGDGTVEDIGIFYTTLTTPDNRSVSIPNSTLSNSTIVNLSSKGTRRVDMDFSIAYESDIDKARSVLLDSAFKHESILKDPPPEAYVSSHSDSSIIMTLRVWTKKDDYWSVRFYLLEEIKKAFDLNGISIPFPQLEVKLKSDGDKQ